MFQGWLGEKKTTFNMSLTLSADVYRRIHNVIISSKNGTTQIDHLLISPYGVFIVETKNLKGWIFGSEGQPYWTQVLYNKKYSFQNPNKQIFRQKRVLSEYLGIDESFIHTIIHFVGDCKFKTHLPANVIRSGLGSYIKRYQKHVLFPEEIDRILKKLDKLASDSSLTARNHIRSLRERHSSNTICPKCGSNLVERMARNGHQTGSKFLGCQNYPRCRFTKDAATKS